jgi:BON domain
MAESGPEPTPEETYMRSRTAILAALAGAAAVYLFDPIKGGARRERLRSAVTRVTRRPSYHREDDGSPLPENLAPTTPGPLDTAVSRVPTPGPIAAPRPGRPTEDVEAGPLGGGQGKDARIAGQVRTRLERRPDLGADDLVIDVVNGVAYLSGDLHDQHTFGEVVDLTREVPGVRRVQSLLHLPPSETIPGAGVKPSDDQDTG